MWGSPGVCVGFYTVFAVCVPTWWHRKSPWSGISLLCTWLPAILLFQAGDQATSVLAIESCLNDIDAWMLTNMLKLNKEKTELLVITLALKLSISALNQRCDALEKSQILSRRSIIQLLKPRNNPMIKQLSLIRKTRRLQIWSRRSILSWWQHQMSVRELRHDRPSLRFSKSRDLSASVPSFLPHPLPVLLLAPCFARSFTLFPRSLLLNRTETLATQAI